MQQETDERRTRMEVDKMREEVKDRVNAEERLKSDHAQHVIDLMDEADAERQKNASESEERFLA